MYLLFHLNGVTHRLRSHIFARVVHTPVSRTQFQSGWAWLGSNFQRLFQWLPAELPDLYRRYRRRLVPLGYPTLRSTVSNPASHSRPAHLRSVRSDICLPMFSIIGSSLGLSYLLDRIFRKRKYRCSKVHWSPGLDTRQYLHQVDIRLFQSPSEWIQPRPHRYRGQGRTRLHLRRQSPFL